MTDDLHKTFAPSGEEEGKVSENIGPSVSVSNPVVSNNAQADDYWNNDRTVQSMKEMENFLESPSSVGFDKIKPALANSVMLMNELMGYDTGYTLHQLASGEHSSLAMEGTLKGDKEKARHREFLRFIEEFERIMEEQFQNFYESVSGKIDDLRNVVDQKLDRVEETLAKAADGKIVSSGVLERAVKKKKSLKLFKKRLDIHEDALEDAEDTNEVMQIHEDLEDDLGRFTNHDLAKKTGRKIGAFALMGSICAVRKASKGLYLGSKVSAEHLSALSGRMLSRGSTDTARSDEEDMAM